MFGHQDNVNDQTDNTNSANPEPQPDATLGHDAPNDSTSAGHPPVIPPSEEEDTAGSFIVTESQQHGDEHAAASNEAQTPPAASTPGVPEDLLELKQGALQQLAPLLDHLEQTPEEKFRTTMMMIQASDNQSLLQTAYETAQKITDEKARAQALLDVVNEINYFTQQSGDSETAEN